MVVSKILYGDIPDMKMMVLFCILLGIFAIGAPGVPGGNCNGIFRINYWDFRI